MKGIILEILFTITILHSVEPYSFKTMLDLQQLYEENNVNNSVSIVSRIVNGELAVDGQFPYQVYILPLGTKDCVAERKHCGGSIIAKNWVLTAGHCVHITEENLDKFIAFEIQVGSVIADEPRQRKIVLPSNGFAHPEYNPETLVNDIALIKMDTNFNFKTPYVQPIALVAANTDKASYVGQIVTASGFGYTTPVGPNSNELRYTTLTVIDFDVCNSTFPGGPDTVICAQDESAKESSTCPGDSGGPITLVMNGKTTQIGLVSYGGPVCNEAPGGYTDVAIYIQWIQEVMKTHK